MKRFKRWNDSTDSAGRHADKTALTKNIDTKTIHLTNLIGEVQCSVLSEELLLLFAHDLKDQTFDPFFRHGLARCVFEFAVNADFGGQPHLQVKITGI